MSLPALPMIIFTLALSLTLHTNNGHNNICSESFYQLIKESRNISACKQLATLGAEFGWKINESNQSQIEIIFGMQRTNIVWLAWGVNPRNEPQMVGTRAIIGIKQPNDTLYIGTYNITSDVKRGCGLKPSATDVEFRNMSMEYNATVDYYTIGATVVLPFGYNIARLNHVWQIGYVAEGTQPGMHPITLQNFDSAETINLKTGYGQHSGQQRHHLRMVHGIVNIIGWGTFLPIGAITARYFRYPLELQNWWFRLHISFQIIGYILGTIGWTIGLWLGHASRRYSFRTHRLYAIFIFTFSTLQMLALRLRPKETDDYRKHWNMYHHFLGYALLAVISINIFQGIAILKPDNITWKRAYIGILVAFAIVVTAFEICSWTKFKFRKGEEQETTKSSLKSTQEGSSSAAKPSSSSAPQPIP